MSKIIDLQEDKSIKQLVETRLAEFQAFKNANSHEIFKEMCFCILTAGTSADLCLRVCDEVGDQFLKVNCQEEFTRLLKKSKYRFYNVRGGHLEKACIYRNNIKDIIDSYEDERELRDWIVKNIRGLGYKEASHFMRNIGYENVAIIDFHIVDMLVDHGIIEKFKTMTKKRYLATEKVLETIATKVDLNLAALDLYMWHHETGKILK